MKNDALDILKAFKLRHTDTRQNILEGFLSKTMALSHGDVEQILKEGYDRVTVYRTLKTFTDSGILHKILDDEGGIKYGLCTHKCTADKHSHDHVHFKCNNCNATTCLDHTHIPNFELPMGYKKVEMNMLVLGTCPNCQH